MKKFNPMLLIWHVKELWNRDADLQGDGNVVSQEDLNEATADPVEDGDTLKEAVLKLQKQIDELSEEPVEG